MAFLHFTLRTLLEIGVVVGFFAAFFFPFALYCALVRSSQISDHERRERVNPFPHGPNQTNKNEVTP